MASKLFCAFLFATYLLASSQELDETIEFSATNLVVDARSTPLANTCVACGNQVLSGEMGSIMYKVSESLEWHERCVWEIRAPNATGYSVGVAVLGFPQPTVDHKLTITSFQAYGPPDNVVVDHLGIYNFSPSYILVVTLHTGNPANMSDLTGFHLNYTSHVDGSYNISSRFPDNFWDATKDEIIRERSGSHSVGITMMLNHISSWGTALYDPHNEIYLSYVCGEGWTSDDFVEVYVYNVDTNWLLNRTITHENKYGLLHSNDLVILVFRTRIAYIHEFITYFTKFYKKASILSN